MLGGDEKVFRFTGRDGIVRKVPKKPARMGIWHYQAVVSLSTEEPFLAYTRVHNTSENLGESTRTARIVNEWADLVLLFDSHQLPAWILTICAKWDAKACFIAAIKPDRFKSFASLLVPQSAISEERNEACGHALVAGQDNRQVHAHQLLSRVPQKKRTDYIPVYDEYKRLFSG